MNNQIQTVLVYGAAGLILIGQIAILIRLLLAPPIQVDRWGIGVIVSSTSMALLFVLSPLGFDMPMFMTLVIMLLLNVALVMAVRLVKQGQQTLSAALGLVGCVVLLFALRSVRMAGYENVALLGLIILAIALVFLITAFIPLLKLLLTEPSADPASSGNAVAVPERDRVLKLLEAERITADEAAELLVALGPTQAVMSEQPQAWTVARKLMLAGAALVVIGFFIPWFQVRTGQFLQGLTAQTQIGTPVSISPPPGYVDGVGLPPGYTHSFQFPTIAVSGGDISNGLGWLILTLGITTAMLPSVAPQMSRSNQRTVMRIATGAGMLISLYLLTRNYEWASFGIVAVLIGFGLQAIGLFRELPRRAVSVEPVSSPSAVIA